MLIEEIKLLKGLAPAADRFNTSPYTDIFSLKHGQELTFLIYHSGGTTGQGTFTVEACDDVSASNVVAIPFRYRKVATGTSDAQSAIADAAAAGISTVAAEDAIFAIAIKAQDLPAGYPYARCKLAEAVNDPVNAVCIGVLSDLRYGGESQASAIV